MKLRGIDFGHVLDGSGARSWFGEGHAFHRYGRPFGLRFDGSTFVAKTTTLNARAGNAAIRSNGLTPRVINQPAVKVNWRKGAVLNAFGLPGPGFEALLARGRWQRITQPFFLSFMAIEDNPIDSLREVRGFVRLLKAALPTFSAPIGLQVNYSCPNVSRADHLAGFRAHLNEYQELGIPIMVKLSVTTPVGTAVEISQHYGCDAICVSNSIPWGEFREQIDWKGLFGSQSPLERFGGGGLSGKPLLPIVAEWIRSARRAGLRKHINAGGGILKPADVDVMLHSGANSVFVGSIVMLRPWRLQKIIRHANTVLAEAELAEEVPLAALKRA